MPNDATITLRLPEEDLRRADELLQVLEKNPELRAARVSRSVVLRLAIDMGLEALKAKYTKKTPAPVVVSKPTPDPAQAVRKLGKRVVVPDGSPPAQLRAWRKAKELTQQAVADETGISRSIWGDYETGKKKPGEENARLLEKLTGIPETAWFDERNED
jgi:DNA-binding transcriptional regulator YiaG